MLFETVCSYTNFLLCLFLSCFIHRECVSHSKGGQEVDNLENKSLYIKVNIFIISIQNKDQEQKDSREEKIEIKSNKVEFR